jgi:hypothetical protein
MPKPTVHDFVGKEVLLVERDYCDLTVEFTDGTKLIVRAEGYEGTRLEVWTEVEETVTQKVKKKVGL